MAIADAFPRASFNGLEFLYQTVEITGSLDHHIHKYIHRPGGEVESLGRHLYEVSFAIQFDANVKAIRNFYPQRLAELISVFETEGTYDLVIPTRGVRAMKAKATKWSTNFTAKIRSGEAVKFTFLEDGTDQFSAYAIVQVASQDLYTLAWTARTKAALHGKPGLFDQLLAAIQKLDELRAQEELWAYKVQVQILSVLDVCDKLMRTADIFNDPIYVDTYLAFQEVFAAAIRIQTDVMGTARIVDKYFNTVDRGVTELALAIYGDTMHVEDVLQCNSFSNALHIPAGTIVNYYVT